MVPKTIGCCLNLQLQRHENGISTHFFFKNEMKKNEN
jgi:hypothetical protein